MSDLIINSTAEIAEFTNEKNKLYFGFIKNYHSKHTRISYLKELKKFHLFLKLRCKGLSEFAVEHAHMVAYKEELMTLGGERKDVLSQATINRAISCLHAFYEYLIDEAKVTDNPVSRIKRFKIPSEVKTMDLTDEEVLQILTIIPTDSGVGLLHNAILNLLFTTGMREREIANLKIGSIFYEGKVVAIKYVAKGQKEIVKALNPKARDTMFAYLKWCQENGYSLNPADPLFRPTRNPRNPGELNKSLDNKAMNYIIKKYAKIIGIQGNVRFHSGRATVIGQLLEKGNSIDRVANFVGHSSMQSTKNYDKRKSKITQSLSFQL